MGQKDKILILTGVSYGLLLNPVSGEKTAGIHRLPVGQGMIYVAKTDFSREIDFVAYETPQPLFLGSGSNPLLCDSPKYLEKDNTPGNATRTCSFREFSQYDLETDPLLEKPLKTEAENFYPRQSGRIKCADREIEFKEGENANSLLVVDPVTQKKVMTLVNYFIYFSFAFRSEHQLFLISNDIYDWDSRVQRIDFPIDAPLCKLPTKTTTTGKELLGSGTTLSSMILTGAVVDKACLDKIVRNYEVGDFLKNER